MKRTALLLVAHAASTGCTDAGFPTPGNDEAPPPLPFDALPEFTEPCDLDPADENGILVTTTDFSTGAVTVIDARTGDVRRDLALVSTDAIPFWHAGRAFVVNRFQHDYVDVLDPGRSFASIGQFAIDVPHVNASNPHSIAFDGEGLGWVPLFGAPLVQILDVGRPPTDALVDVVHLGAFADPDGNPEASLAVRCGDLLFVSVERLDPTFNRTGSDALVAIDIEARRAVDLDPDQDGAQGWPVAGAWIRQMRRDPRDPAGHTLLLLTTGIERIDLRTGEVTWAVTPERLAEVGIEHFFQPQAFDVDAAGEVAYLAAYTEPPAFEQVKLYRVGLDDHLPTVPEPFAEGLLSNEHTLELIGDRLWYGSAQTKNPGMWVFDVGMTPPVAVDGPLSTGLPPYASTSIVLP